MSEVFDQTGQGETVGTIEARRTASGVAGTGDTSDRSVDSVLRPDPGEVKGAGELVQHIDALLGTKRTGRLVGPDGDEVEIPASVMAALRLVAVAMAQGQAVTVAPHDLELTTQEAADLLHVSRPHLIKLLDRREMAHHRMSEDSKSHRRVLLKDVLAYRQQRQQTRRGLLRELTEASEDMPGGYS